MTFVHIRRTIVVEYTFSDRSGPDITQYDDIDSYTNADIIRDERRTLLSTWAGNTEYQIISDEITAERESHPRNEIAAMAIYRN